MKVKVTWIGEPLIGGATIGHAIWEGANLKGRVHLLFTEGPYFFLQTFPCFLSLSLFLKSLARYFSIDFLQALRTGVCVSGAMRQEN